MPTPKAPSWRERLVDVLAYVSPAACVVALACVAFGHESGVRIAVTIGVAGMFTGMLLGEIDETP